MKKPFRRITVIVAVLVCIVGYFYQRYSGCGMVFGESITSINQLMLVNNTNNIGRGYIPQGLVIPDIEFINGVNTEEKHICSIIKSPLESMIAEALKDGIIIKGCSGYRSYKSQEVLYNNSIESQGKQYTDSYVAKPGSSEHQSGLCIDLTNISNNLIEGTDEAQWLDKNAYRFGFIIRYPKGKENITGIDYEPWHVRYVGKDAARYIYEKGITLEEYLNK